MGELGQYPEYYPCVKLLEMLGGYEEKAYLSTSFKRIGDKIMSTAVLSNGTSYYIPSADLSFFTELAERMKWQVISKVKQANKTAKIDQAMAFMDTMMVKGGTSVPADADGLDILVEEKYSR